MVGENNNKIKILYVITKSNWGGAGRYVYDLATNMPKGDFDVAVVIGLNPADTQEKSETLQNKLGRVGIRTIAVDRLERDINIFDDISVFFKILKLFRQEKPDIIHLNSSKIGGIGALAGRVYNIFGLLRTKDRKLKTRIVFTAHGWAFNEVRGKLQKILIKFFSWITIILSHHTITVSKHDGEQGRKMFFATKKITIIHNGISEVDFKNKAEACNALLGSKASEFGGETVWLGTIAELHKNKGIEYAIKALSHIAKYEHLHENITFVFVIIGEGEERKNLENLIEKEGLKNKVFLVGHIENAASFLGAFDIFLLPSIKEGLPYVLLEAGIGGLPAVATAVGGVAEIIEDMESGILIQPQNYKDIEKAITFLSKNKIERGLFGEKLHKKIIRKFSMQEMLKKTIGVY